MNERSKLTFKQGLKDGLPISLGYVSVSFAFGVKASLLGVPVLITLLTSLSNLTSTGQLAGIDIVAALGSFAEIILIQLVINSRYVLMSITLTQKTDDSFTFGKRLLTATFITDEIFAMAASKPGKIGVKYFTGLALLPYFGWAAGTLLGALAGNFLPQSVALALGIALYAMFMAIIIPPATVNPGIFVSIAIAAGVSCLFYYLPALKYVSQGFALIIAAIAASFITAYFFPIRKKAEPEQAADSAEEADDGSES